MHIDFSLLAGIIGGKEKAARQPGRQKDMNKDQQKPENKKRSKAATAVMMAAGISAGIAVSFFFIIGKGIKNCIKTVESLKDHD